MGNFYSITNDQQEETEDVGEKSRCQQNGTSHENHDAVHDLAGRAAVLIEVEEDGLSRLQHRLQLLEGAEPILYSSAAYPYFFIDTDANGAVDPGEAIFPNRYATWTPRLLQAAYNYQYAAKDPGGFAHNGAYILQLLYDSIDSIGGEVGDLTRP